MTRNPRQQASVMAWLLVLALCWVGLHEAAAAQELTLCTDWYAQAEHGGYYEAAALGLYQKAGLTVRIRMGGAQVNTMQLLLARRCDAIVTHPLRSLATRAQNLPVVTIMASFQHDPTALLAHADVPSLEALRGHPIAIAQESHLTFWPWLKARYGFTDDQIRPYSFSVAPFLKDPRLAQEGYVTSEPFAMAKAGVTPKVFLLADQGYPPYAGTIVVTEATMRRMPEALRALVRSIALGWQHYLQDPAPGNAMIRRDNPAMSPEQLAFGLREITARHLLSGGDARTMGIGTMTTERWKAIIACHDTANPPLPAETGRAAYSLDFLPRPPVLPQAP